MATRVKMSVTLEPIDHPCIIIDLNGQWQMHNLTDTTDFDFDFQAQDSVCLKIMHINKPEMDADTAVVVKKISFFGIEDRRFLYQGTYYPDYPKHYTNEKIAAMPGCTYLGWNGTYELSFTVPVFTWIHKVQGLGWIYN